MLLLAVLLASQLVVHAHNHAHDHHGHSHDEPPAFKWSKQANMPEDEIMEEDIETVVGHGHAHAGHDHAGHGHAHDHAGHGHAHDHAGHAHDHHAGHGHAHDHVGHGHSHGGHGHSHGGSGKEPVPEEREKMRQKLHAKVRFFSP
jgi:hypothetical protein